MPEIDSSIIGKLQVPQIDALGAIGKGQAIAQGMLQNRMLSQEVQGKEAMARAVTGATDKETGETDFDKAASMLAVDPQGAWKMPEFSAALLDREAKKIANSIAQQNLTQSQLETTKKKLTAIGDWTASVVSAGAKDPAALTPDAIAQSAAQSLIGTGLINPNDPGEKQQLLAVVQQLTPDPAKNAEVLKRLFLQTHATSEGISMAVGTPTMTDIGPALVQTRTPGLGGPTEVGTAVPKGLSPETLSQLVEVVDPVTKERKKVTLGSLVGQPTGNPDAPVNRGGVTTGLAPGVAEAETAAAGEGVKLAQTWRGAADKAPDLKGQIQNLRDQVGRFTSGPQASWLYRMKAMATMLGVQPPAVRDEVAAQEEFAKLAQQWANANTGQLGEGTDSKLNAALKASPNEFLSQQGVTGILALLEGQQDAAIAKDRAWQKWLDAGNSPGSAAKFNTEFNKLYNPRVFQAQYMDDKQKKVMLGGMSEKERADFERSWKFAKAAGWIK